MDTCSHCEIYLEGGFCQIPSLNGASESTRTGLRAHAQSLNFENRLLVHLKLKTALRLLRVFDMRVLLLEIVIRQELALVLGAKFGSCYLEHRNRVLTVRMVVVLRVNYIVLARNSA